VHCLTRRCKSQDIPTRVPKWLFWAFCGCNTKTKNILDCYQSHVLLARIIFFCILTTSEATHGQASVCAERRCTADLQSLSSRPHSAVTAQITLASDARTYFVPAGSAGVSLPPRLCTWLPGLRSSARVTPQRTSTTALFDFDYISAGRSTHCAFYHWQPHLSSDCCIGLEQSAVVGPDVSVVASFPQQTENWTFCLVLQSWLTTSHCTDYYYVTSLFKLIVTCPCRLRLNATLKLIRSSSSLSSTAF